MYDLIPNNPDFPKNVNGIIEIPKGTNNKYEYDEKLGIMKLDRVLHSPMYYPVDYGFIPQTRSDDGDHLDIMVMTNFPVFTGCLVETRPIGVLIMSDENGDDEKVLAVPLKNPSYHEINTLKDVSSHFLMEIVHFFTEYKRLENKSVDVKGWKDRSDAYKIIKEQHKKYLQEDHVLPLILANSAPNTVIGK